MADVGTVITVLVKMLRSVMTIVLVTILRLVMVMVMVIGER